MMIGLLSVFRQFLQGLTERSLVNEMAYEQAGEPFVAQAAAHREHLFDLPLYPKFGALTDGQQHRMELLSGAIADLTQGLMALRKFSKTDFGSRGATRKRLSAAVLRSATLADVVVSEFLFETPVGAKELDDELFEIMPMVRPLAAAKVSGRLEGETPFTVRSNSTGEVNPMLYGAYS